MGEVSRLPIADDRETGLHATWHHDEKVLVLSVWHQNQCVGTVRLDADRATDLAAFLFSGLLDLAEVTEDESAGG